MSGREAFFKIAFPIICFIIVATIGLGVYFGVYFRPNTGNIAAPKRQHNPAMTEDEKLAQKYEFSLNSKNNGYRIDRVKDRETQNLVVPELYKNLPITDIGAGAFARHNTLVSVVLDEKIDWVGSFAFSSCSNLSSLRVESKTIKIDQYAFASCLGLVDVYIEQYSDNLNKNAFVNCGVINLTINSGVVGNAFGADPLYDEYNDLDDFLDPRVTSLQKVVLGEGVTEIEVGAFAGSTNLYIVQNSSPITKIGVGAFYQCESLTTIPVMSDNAVFGAGAFYLSGITQLRVKPNWTLGGAAFLSCKNLVDLEFEEGVASLPVYCFEDCTGIASLSIPASLVDIGEWAFCRCSKIEHIEVDSQNPVLYVDGNCLIDGSQKKLLVGTSSSVIPNDGSVVKIGEGAFVAKSIQSIVIPESVTEIGWFAFKESEIENITILSPNIRYYGASFMSSVIENLYMEGWFSTNNSSGYWPVSFCDAIITNFTLNSGELKTGTYFFNNTIVKNLVLGAQFSGFTDWGRMSGLIGIESITVDEENTKWRSSGNCLIMNWDNQIFLGCKNSVIPQNEGIQYINSGAFDFSDGLTTLEIPSTIRSVGDINCKTLKTVVFKQGIDWGNYVFIHTIAGDHVVFEVYLTSVDQLSYAESKLANLGAYYIRYYY